MFIACFILQLVAIAAISSLIFKEDFKFDYEKEWEKEHADLINLVNALKLKYHRQDGIRGKKLELK